MYNPFDLDSSYDDEKKELERKQNYAGNMQNAISSGQNMAMGIGSQAGEAARAQALAAGAGRGAAETISNQVANEATQNATQSEIEKANAANQEAVAEQEKNVAEAQAEREEKLAQLDKVGGALNAAGTAALTAVNPLLGAGVGGLVGLGRSALNTQAGKGGVGGMAARIGSTLLSDERLKYKSKIKNPNLRK